MKKLKTIFISILVLLFLSGLTEIAAQDTTSVKNTKEPIKGKVVHGRTFVDKNGDGYNDNAPDHDGDGIPNGLDPDYLKFKNRNKKRNLPYVDLDGDGINDNLKFNPFMKGFWKNRLNVITPQDGNNQGNGNNSGNGQRNKKGKGGKK